MSPARKKKISLMFEKLEASPAQNILCFHSKVSLWLSSADLILATPGKDGKGAWREKRMPASDLGQI